MIGVVDLGRLAAEQSANLLGEVRVGQRNVGCPKRWDDLDPWICDLGSFEDRDCRELRELGFTEHVDFCWLRAKKAEMPYRPKSTKRSKKFVASAASSSGSSSSPRT